MPCPRTPFFRFERKIGIISCIFTNYFRNYSKNIFVFETRCFLSRNNVSEILGMQFLITDHSLTLSFPLEAEYDLNYFNVLYLNILERSTMLDFCTTRLENLERNLPLFIRVIGKELPKMKGSKRQLQFLCYLGNVSRLLRSASGLDLYLHPRL